jgi:hypothetical protein
MCKTLPKLAPNLHRGPKPGHLYSLPGCFGMRRDLGDSQEPGPPALRGATMDRMLSIIVSVATVGDISAEKG